MTRRLRARLAALLSVCLAMTPGAMTTAEANHASARYVSGGTAVVRTEGQAVVDEGSVVCDAGNGIGAGGFCLPFGGPGEDAIEIVDDEVGHDVAYQVCLDNSGDGVCTSPDQSGYCADVVVFSHYDDGSFDNPVGPLPTGFTSGCRGGPWKGYVVFLCEGVHEVGVDNHVHAATSGTGTLVSSGEGNQGTFCGGGPVPSRKRYAVGSGARYTNGGTVVARGTGSNVADEGVVVCNDGDNAGIGGFCVSFGDGDAIAVFDQAAGEDIAFQACVDNNGDGLCTSPDTSTWCPDQMAFSHDDQGNFFNPLGPLPTGFLSGCPGGPWRGYVVFVCQGVHADGVIPHTHDATTGTGRVTTDGEGLGTFCGGSQPAPSRKRYVLDLGNPLPSGEGTDGPRGFLCSLSAVTDPNPEADANDLTGVIEAGPATTDEAGTLICTIQVNASTHNGPDAAVREFASDANGVVAGAQTVSFSTAEDAQDFVCTSFRRADGTTIYFTGGDNARWHFDPSGECSPATQGGTQDLFDIVDGALCPELAAQHPGTPPASSSGSYIDDEGDVFVDFDNNGIQENAPDSSDAMADLFYDCPVYTFTINDANANPDRDDFVDPGVIDY